MSLAADVVGGSVPGAAPPFEVERLTGVIGAEVTGLDLAKPLSPACVDALGAALVRHKVLFFRDQDISAEQHLAFGRYFGELEVHPFNPNLDAAPQVIVVESRPDAPLAASTWHSDVTWRREPSLASILRARVLPSVGGDTLWANMAAAYEGLDDRTRAQISSLTAVHDWEGFRGRMRQQGTPEARIAELQAQFPPVEHPVVRTHPVSGEKIIYVNPGFTTHIKGMKADESRALLDRLYRMADKPEYQVRFRWRVNSIAFWDNRSTQHYGAPDFFPEHRRMERVTVIGDRPF